MLTVANSTIGCFPFVLERPVQLTKERHCSIGIQRNFPAISWKYSIQTRFWLLLRVCVCVTENKNLCKGTAVRFSLTGSTGQREPFQVGPSVSIEISRQFGTMESTPSMPLLFI